MRNLFLALLVVPLISCSLFQLKDEAESKAPVDNVEGISQEGQVSVTTELVDVKLHSLDIATANPESEIAPSQQPQGLIEPTKSLTGPSPEVGLRYLRNGNIRFVKGHLRNDGQSKKDIQRVAKQEKPHSVVITVSNSSVPPEIIFDQKLGEIFVIRTLNLIYNPEFDASLHYAVEVLGVRNIVILGLKDGEQNATTLANKLTQNSLWLQNRLSNAEVVISVAYYDFNTGEVVFK